ncbi:MAG: dTDP-4-dehydrorhamnose reductase [Bacteroidia bacterium]|nr:dTDP-4-dehydrorhamnose reductase [Bacteroidia bacterium]MDW8301715.1 dTDP-4-dehydrorhamnose reductase [Bacteroidia bacterium]
MKWLKKVLVTGTNGLLGQSLVYYLTKDAYFKVYGLSKGKNRIEYDIDHFTYYNVDITDLQKLKSRILKIQPDIIIHTAAMTQVDQCEQNKAQCYKLNVEATKNLLQLAEQIKSHFIFLSTDFVFDGKNGPYQEKDTPNPLSYYGNTKLIAEQMVQASLIPWTIVRTVLVYGYHLGMRRNNILSWVVQNLKNEQTIHVVNDQYRTPTFVDDLARAIIHLAHQQKTGIYHISGAEMCSVYEFAQMIADVWGLHKSYIQPISSKKLNQPAQRPPKTGFIILKSQLEIGYTPHTLKEALYILKQRTKEIL